MKMEKREFVVTMTVPKALSCSGTVAFIEDALRSARGGYAQEDLESDIARDAVAIPFNAFIKKLGVIVRDEGS